jgi:hypothetical protein
MLWTNLAKTYIKLKQLLFFGFLLMFKTSFCQVTANDTILITLDSSKNAVVPIPNGDSILRIINLNPFFTLQVDSSLSYDLQINKTPENYYWFIKNAPLGLKIDKNTGLVTFKAEKGLFKSGKLKYDIPYKVELGVQNLKNPKERADTIFTILIYSTEVIVSKLKPTIGSSMELEEGDSIRFRVQCEDGTFPIEQITILTNEPINKFKSVNKCDDEFAWMVPFNFIKENDTTRLKTLVIQFIGIDKFQNKDTATVRLRIRPGINYPEKITEYNTISDEMKKYITNLKLTFYVISRNIKNTKTTRTGFDISSSTTAMLGTILATTGNSEGSKNTGKVLPSVGLTLVPVKEAVSPVRVQEQNTASQIRAAIKRLEYMYSEAALVGERDPEIISKMRKMREEIKQSKLQLVDLPLVEFDPRYTQEDADKYFNNPKVIKKYKLKVN